jgi:hypothetical protein
MLTCIKWRSDPRHPEVTRALQDDAIEEFTTYFVLAREAVNLHMGF